MRTEDMSIVKSMLPFWDKLTDEQAALLSANIRSVRFQSGEVVHSGSNDCIGILLLKTGQLRSYILSDEGKEVTLFRMDDSEVCVLSASCLLASITFDLFIEAVNPSELYLIDTKAFSQVIEQNIYVENFALRMTAERFSEVMWAMEQILFMSFDRRLAIFLLDETAKTGVDNITMTHEQIARYVGSAREVVSRMLKYFAKEGIVAVHRGGVELLDKQKLRKLL